MKREIEIIRWAPKTLQSKIRNLYEKDAHGEKSVE